MNIVTSQQNQISFGRRDKVTGMQDREHSVAILGTSRENENTEVYCRLSKLCAEKLAQKDFDVWTGGASGVNKSANSGADSVSPKTSWAVHTRKFLDEMTLKIRALGIYKEPKDKDGKEIITDSAPERTTELMERCNHSIMFPGGPGSGQELWNQLEAKAYKWSPDDLSIDDINLVNDRDFYSPHLNALDNMEKMKLASNPDKSKPLSAIINNKIDIDADELKNKPDQLDKLATQIVNHIIEESNKNSDEQIEIF